MVFNVGIVGTGIFATDRHLPVLAQNGALQPYAAYNRTKAKAVEFAEKAGIDQQRVFDSLESLLAEPGVDVVDALLPVQTNVDVIRAALKHNKPIAVEKPVAATLAQAREIVRMAQELPLPVAVLEQWAFLTAIGRIRLLLPQIGAVAGFTYRATGPWNANNKYLATLWRQNPEHIGGFLSDGGVHQLALLTEVLGSVRSVLSLAKQLHAESGAEDVMFATFQMESGAIGTFTYGLAFGATEKLTLFTIYGTRGSIVYDFSPALPKPTISLQTGDSAQSASKVLVEEVEEVDTVAAEFDNFAEAVAKRDKLLVRVPPAKAFHHLAIIAAALDSAKAEGTAVKVEQP